MAALTQDGAFIERPAFGSKYRDITSREEHTVAASWPHGVVMEGGPIVTANDLLAHYEPQCSICKAFHEPEYPHENTPDFRQYIFLEYGRGVIESDTFAHCSGVLLEAMKRAMEA